MLIKERTYWSNPNCGEPASRIPRTDSPNTTSALSKPKQIHAKITQIKTVRRRSGGCASDSSLGANLMSSVIDISSFYPLMRFGPRGL
jgi:hypothetical protein